MSMFVHYMLEVILNKMTDEELFRFYSDLIEKLYGFKPTELGPREVTEAWVLKHLRETL